MEVVHDLSYMLPLLIAAFLAIVFLQSGIDKLFDWKGNLTWLNSHFEKTILGGFVPVLLGIVTLFELLAGVLAVFGAIYYLLKGTTFWINQSLIVAMISLLMLIFGQRIAKDYEGAKTIAIYFGVALISALILSWLWAIELPLDK